MKKIGITTTVPCEVLLAAGYHIIDLNNIFVTDAAYDRYIEIAERDGFPKSTCAWIKGLYGVCLEHDIPEVVGVTEGDCSNTRALIETMALRGIRVHPFAYPISRSRADMERELQHFMGRFGVTAEQAEVQRQRLLPVRQLARQLDERTWQTDKVSGFENHLFQVSMSDFDGDPEGYSAKLRGLLDEVDRRAPQPKPLRLGYIGVPPMTGDLYDFVEEFGGRIIYNEVQREFAFPRADAARDLAAQYVDYTYPYDIETRIAEIQCQIETRKLDAIIHYTQAFCYRAIEDIVLKARLNVPMLTMEGDKLNRLDARTKLRLEAFLDMLHDLKETDE